MDKPRLSVVETEAVSVEHTVVRAWDRDGAFCSRQCARGII